MKFFLFLIFICTVLCSLSRTKHVKFACQSNGNKTAACTSKPGIEKVFHSRTRHLRFCVRCSFPRVIFLLLRKFFLCDFAACFAQNGGCRRSGPVTPGNNVPLLTSNFYDSAPVHDVHSFVCKMIPHQDLTRISHLVNSQIISKNNSRECGQTLAHFPFTCFRR